MGKNSYLHFTDEEEYVVPTALCWDKTQLKHQK